MPKFLRVSLSLGLAFVSGVFADQVTLKNGDRITGKILTSDDKSLTLKTDFLGEVKIDRAGVVAISSDEPLNVTLPEGQKVKGTLATTGSTLTVRQTDATQVSTDLAKAAIRSDAAQQAWEREQERLTHPRLNDFWSGAANFGLALASGNASTTTLNTGFAARRITGKDKISLNFAQIYATQSTTPPEGATANRVSGGARYDRDLYKRLFVFGTADFDFDEFQDLDLRSVLGGGLGYHIFKNDRGFWDVGAGGAWNREEFSTGLVRYTGELLITEESSHDLTSVFKLFQKLSLYPNLSETGEFRLAFDGGLSAKVFQNVELSLTFSDRYLSNPLPGNKTNDIIFATGVRYSFEQK